MPLQAVEPRRLYRQIAEQLARLIETGEYRPGDRLPPERSLAETLNVSRPSVREALIALEVEGRIEIRGGSGIYVTAGSARASLRPDVGADPGPFELLEARLIIEPEMAAMAARNATPVLADRLDEAIARMEASDADRLEGLSHDRRFHLILAEGAGNAALALVLDTLWDSRTGPIYIQLERHFHSAPIWHRAVDEHKAIADAVAARDPKRARTAMARHLKNARDRFGSNWRAAKAR